MGGFLASLCSFYEWDLLKYRNKYTVIYICIFLPLHVQVEVSFLYCFIGSQGLHILLRVWLGTVNRFAEFHNPCCNLTENNGKKHILCYVGLSLSNILRQTIFFYWRKETLREKLNVPTLRTVIRIWFNGPGSNGPNPCMDSVTRFPWEDAIALYCCLPMKRWTIESKYHEFPHPSSSF